MNNNDNNRFSELMIACAELSTPAKSISQALMGMYTKAFQNYSIEQIEQAFNEHITKSKFFPHPSEIVSILTPNQRSVEDKANIAWMEIEVSIRKIGTYGDLQLEDKQALMAVKSCGGWPSICATRLDKMQWKKREFIEAYRAIENTPLELLPTSLDGIAALENQRNQDTKPIQAILCKTNLLNKD